MTLLAPTLFFLYQPGCAACSAAEPELDKFKKMFPNLMVIRLNVAAHEWRIAGWRSAKTPGYALKINNDLVWNHVGTLSAVQLKKHVGRELE